MPYIGNPAVVGDSTNTFKLLDDIQSFTLTFDATDTSVVSISGDTLTFNNHRFLTGQRVTYNDGGGTAIGGLADGVYFIIKVDQNTIQLATNASNAAAGTAIDLTSGAAGGSHTLNVAFDGVNTKFSATHSSGTKASISRAAQISLSINGVIQQPQDTGSPTTGYGVLPGSIIIFSTPPASVDKVFGTFIGEVAPSFDIDDNTIDNFTGDGSTVTFNLSKDVPSSHDVLVTLDGVTQYPTDSSTVRAYSVIESTLTFVSAPATGVAIQVRHIGFAGASSSAVTGFYGRQGNVALKSTDDVSVQNISGVGATFTSNVNIEGVLTYEDVTNVDSIGIITARAGVLVGSGITLSKDGDGFFTGIVTATTFSGALAASSLTGALPAISGANLTNLDASDLASGTVPTARLGSGTASSSTFLRGDSTFQTVNTDLVSDTSPQLGGNLDTNDKNIVFGDSDGGSGTDNRAVFGAGSDFQLYHDATDSRIQNATGVLRVLSADFRVQNAANTETQIKAVQNGAVELYYDNAKKLETTADGILTQGTILHRGAEGGTAQIRIEADEGDDNADKWRLISQTDGTFDLQNLASGSYETNISATGNGAVELYHNNGKVLETTANGVNITGQSTFVQHSTDANLLIGSTGAGGAYLVLDGDSNGDGAGGDYAYLLHNTSGNLQIATDNPNSDSTIEFRTNGTHRSTVSATGMFEPALNNTYDLGTSSLRWRNIYTNDLNLSNKGSTNSVDNTWGDYTIQEGESDLFLINNRSGKKYKFNLTEVL